MPDALLPPPWTLETDGPRAKPPIASPTAQGQDSPSKAETGGPHRARSVAPASPAPSNTAIPSARILSWPGTASAETASGDAPDRRRVDTPAAQPADAAGETNHGGWRQHGLESALAPTAWALICALPEALFAASRPSATLGSAQGLATAAGSFDGWTLVGLWGLICLLNGSAWAGLQLGLSRSRWALSGAPPPQMSQADAQTVRRINQLLLWGAQVLSAGGLFWLATRGSGTPPPGDWALALWVGGGPAFIASLRRIWPAPRPDSVSPPGVACASRHVEDQTLIVGAGERALRLYRQWAEESAQGQGAVRLFDERQPANQTKGVTIEPLSEAIQALNEGRARTLVLTWPMDTPIQRERLKPLLDAWSNSAASLSWVPPPPGWLTHAGSVRATQLDAQTPMLILGASPFQGLWGGVKRLEDLLLGALILPLIAPVLALVAVGVKASSPGPVIFRQRRHGLDGREIVVWKFRSMRVMEDGPVVTQAHAGDPRITPFGAFIRRTSLDELPQFFHVLQGRMSVVGPRPHALAHNQQWRRDIPAYMRRHQIRPGITGWAQVMGHRGETRAPGAMQARIHHDLAYLRHWSPGLDLFIIWRTLFVLRGDPQAV